MLPILHIGPLAIQTPGLILLIGLWLGLSAAERQASRHGLNASQVYNLVLASVITGIVAARLAYAGRYPAAFLDNPASLFSLNPGLLDAWGGAAGALLAALLYGRRSRLPFWPALDGLTHLLAVFALALALSHLASGDAFGAPADLPWSIFLWGASRHPSQLYEATAALFILLALWPGKGLFQPGVPGTRFLGFIALSAAARLFLEAFRGDSVLLLNGLRQAQLLAWLVLALSLWGLKKRLRTNGTIQV